MVEGEEDNKRGGIVVLRAWVARRINSEN